MPWSAAIAPRPFLTRLVFHTSTRSSKKFFVGVLPYLWGYLMSRPKKTGTKACTFRKVPYAAPTSGIVITTGRYSEKTRLNSGQSDTLTNTENCCLELLKHTKQDMSASALGDGSVLVKTWPVSRSLLTQRGYSGLQSSRAPRTKWGGKCRWT